LNRIWPPSAGSPGNSTLKTRQFYARKAGETFPNFLRTFLLTSNDPGSTILVVDSEEAIMEVTETSHHLGDLQLAIMRILWQREEATVAEVHEALEAERGLALTTIATMLTKMEKKGVVDHRAEGRRFIYRPLVSEDQVRRSMVSDLTSQLFLGDVTALVNHLLSEHEIDARELAQLRELIASRGREEERS
jgi:BlaI family transcriptional regulator, penicillinase repressor